MSFGWQGLLAPIGTPQAVVEKLAKEVDKALANPALAARLTKQGTEPAYQSASEFEKYISEERSRWEKVIHAANIKIQ